MNKFIDTRMYNALIWAVEAGLIASQNTGATPTATAPATLVFDTTSGNAYVNEAGTWTQVAGVDVRKPGLGL